MTARLPWFAPALIVADKFGLVRKVDAVCAVVKGDQRNHESVIFNVNNPKRSASGRSMPQTERKTGQTPQKAYPVLRRVLPAALAANRYLRR
jgi:hypothetical protein